MSPHKTTFLPSDEETLIAAGAILSAIEAEKPFADGDYTPGTDRGFTRTVSADLTADADLGGGRRVCVEFTYRARHEREADSRWTPGLDSYEDESVQVTRAAVYPYPGTGEEYPVSFPGIEKTLF